MLGATHEYVVAANWKVITENYHECYHCPLIHPELCEVSARRPAGPTSTCRGRGSAARWTCATDADTMSLTGAATGVPIDGVDPRLVLYLGLLPNLLLSLHPDYVMTHRMTPLAPDRTRVECAWYFARRPTSTRRTRWTSGTRTNRQDWGACESVQRGLASPHFRPGSAGAERGRGARARDDDRARLPGDGPA